MSGRAPETKTKPSAAAVARNPEGQDARLKIDLGTAVLVLAAY